MDLGKLADYRPDAALRFFLPFSLLFVLYVAAYRLASSLIDGPLWVRWVVVVAPLVFVFALVLTFPIGAIDLYDYTFETRILAHYGLSPLTHVAAEFANDPLLAYVAWPHAPSGAGPSSQTR